ncbi:MAG: hypothetical protein GX444_02945 [Myxococcales bacterium]|nr:hypothetical protein [Myxococcales bacterium]
MKYREFAILLALVALLALVGWTLAACNDINSGRDSDWNDWSLDGGGGAAPADSGDDDDDDSATGCDTTVEPTWATFGQCFVESYCTRCHTSGSGSAPFALDTYEAVHQRAAAVAADVEAGRMPPSAPLPADAEITQWLAWIEAGLPQ